MIFAFGEYELDEDRSELRRNGKTQELQPKVLELLLFLARNRSRVVPTRELLETLWPDTVVTDSSLRRAVSLARLAIGDRGGAAAVIETLPRRGYRFRAALRSRAEAYEGDAGAGYVGREEILRRLTALVVGALAGRGRIVFLAGEAGVGKTRTAEILAERARRSGACVASSLRLEPRAPALLTWTRVLGALCARAPEALASLSEMQRADLARILPELAQTRARGERRWNESVRFRTFEAAHALLAAVAHPHGLALSLDDLHEADAESLRLLEFLGQRISELPLAIVATSREDELDGERGRLLARLCQLTSLERWELAGLRRDEIHAFVRAWRGTEPPPGLAEALERQTDGNPLLLGESLRSLEARGLLDERRPQAAWEALLPRGIEHLFEPKLRALPDGAIEVLRFAAALGVEVERDLLAQVMRATDLDVRLRALAEAELLVPVASRDRLRFSHMQVRDALYAELLPPGDARRRAHARILDAIEEGASESDESLAERAHHACLAIPLVDPNLAAKLARAAAERCARLYDFERAAAWLERALDALEPGSALDSATRAELYLELGAAQTRGVGLERARPSYRLAASHARTARRADLLARAALGFAHRPSSSGEGDAEVVDLLESAREDAPEALRIRLTSRLAAELRYTERERGEALAEEAIGDAGRLLEPAVLAQALEDASFVRFSPDDPDGWLALNHDVVRAAREARDPELELLGHKGCATSALELGDLAGFARATRECQQIAELERTPLARWWSAVLNGAAALLAGDLAVAESRVAESIALGERVDSPEVALELQTQLLYLRVEQGRAREIDALGRTLAERFEVAPVWRAALGRVKLATGQLKEALVGLERLAARDFADVPHDRGRLPTFALAAEVAAATGAEGIAELLESALSPYAALGVVAGSALYYGPVAHHLGLVAGTCARLDAAVERFEQALAVEERMHARVWQARTGLALAHVLDARGRRGDRVHAAELRVGAARIADEHGLADVRAGASVSRRANGGIRDR